MTSEREDEENGLENALSPKRFESALQPAKPAAIKPKEATCTQTRRRDASTTLRMCKLTRTQPALEERVKRPASKFALNRERPA